MAALGRFASMAGKGRLLNNNNNQHGGIVVVVVVVVRCHHNSSLRSLESLLLDAIMLNGIIADVGGGTGGSMKVRTGQESVQVTSPFFDNLF